METLYLECAHGTVAVECARKRVKNMNLRVRRDGTVALSVPDGTGTAEAQSMLERHRRWLERRLARRSAAVAAPLLERGSIPLWGSPVRLDANFDERRQRARARLDAGKAVLDLPTGTPKDAEEQARRLVDRLYRAEVERALPPIARTYEEALGVHAESWSVRRMASRWGSCTPGTGRMRVNLALAAYPPRCLDYVVAHELAHLVEPSHSVRFHSLVASVCPHAVEARALLKRAPAERL